jgi:dehydrogenase/reductase SDR family protein 12
MTGKVVLVTGANKGLGYAAALAMAKLNAEVHLVCRDPSRGTAARDDIAKAAGHNKVFLHQCDVSEYGSVRSFATKFASDTPKLDVLVNNAGTVRYTRLRIATVAQLDVTV